NGNPTLAGKVVVNAVRGVATFSGLSANQPANFAILATAVGMNGAVSNAVVANGSAAAAPAVTIMRAAGPVVAGTSFADTGSFTSSAPGSFRATVDYGDGSGAVPLSLTAQHRFSLAHTYGRAGSFVLKVTVVDRSGVVGRATLK